MRLFVEVQDDEIIVTSETGFVPLTASAPIFLNSKSGVAQTPMTRRCWLKLGRQQPTRSASWVG